MENAIEVKGLTVNYRKMNILNGISFSVPRGGVTAVLGSSGCGKTTLFKHLITLLKPSDGSIFMNGQDITVLDEDGLEVVRKRMGVLFQGTALFNSITLADNIALPMREHTQLEESTLQIMVRMKLDLVGLSGFEDYYPSQLSVGMKKRAGLARAMAMDPEFLFLDEPSAGLDPSTEAGIDELILKLNKAFKMTIVVVTHELQSVYDIADHVIMLDRGEVIFMGTAEELKLSGNERVQMFLERKPDEGVCSPEDYFRLIAGD